MADQDPVNPNPESAGPTPEVEAERFDARASEGRTYDMPPAGDMPPTGDAPPAGGKAAGSLSLAALCHLLGLADFTVSFLLVGVVAPLVLWLSLRDTDAEVDFAGKEAINFQINMLVWWVASLILSICLIGIPMMFALMVVEIVLIIVATVQTLQGDRYRYPMIFRVIR
jgi:uncharacterized Tic20 family protein